MEEPRSRVISLEADNDSSVLNRDNITTGRVDVVSRTALALNDIESVSVKTGKGVTAIGTMTTEEREMKIRTGRGGHGRSQSHGGESRRFRYG